MNTRDQFGNYLLLKRLGEDALGETFRAGRIGQQALERVVLLRVLNAQGFDAEKIARALQARGGLAQALKSPNVGAAVDVGQVRGVPYIAYDYSSGRTLAQLLEQATRRNSALPLDHALLIAERLALGLAVAFETRFGEDRVQHGFVTPGFVQVSNEGELHLLGFEASTGLRDSAAHPLVKQTVGRYLAPEMVAGQPPSRADDVYSLGALLFEMLTGQQVPMMPAGGLGPVLDQANLAAEGSALPADVVSLLRQTLCPRDQRLPDAVTWHRNVTQLISDGGHAATTFNLAFFLHNLFRDEIEREGKELETEKSQAAALLADATAGTAATPASAAAATQAPSATASLREDTAVLRDAYGLPQKKSSNTGVMIGAAAGAIAILAVVGYFVLGGGEGAMEEAPPAVVTEPAPPVETAPPAAEAAEPQAPGMTPEQIQALIDQALSAQKQQLEAGLRAQSDEQLAALRRQLDEAQKAQVAPRPVAPSAARIESLPAASAPDRAEEAARAPAAAPPQQQIATPQQQAPSPPPAAQTQSAQPAPARPTPAPSRPAAQPAPASLAPRAAELVSAGPGVLPPRVVRAPALRYPQLAQRMKREATVTVRVLVDENGRPAEVQPTGSKAGFGMDEAAVDYAKACLWEPAQKNGVKARMWYDMKVTFTLSGGR